MKANSWVCTLMLVLLCYAASAQRDTAMLLSRLSSRYAGKIEAKANSVEANLDKQSRNALKRLQKQQDEVYSSLHKLDSNTAKAFLQNSQQRYTAMLTRLDGVKNPSINKYSSYVPGLDSMNSVLGYLDKLTGSDKLNSLTNLPGKEQLTGALAAATKAGASLDASAAVKKLMQEQKEQLTALAARYKNLNLTRQLKAFNKEIYYYSQRVQQAREILNDPGKIEGAVLKLLRSNKTFQNWIQQNGQLARMFGAPGASNTDPATALAGLQTRQSVEQALQQRLGGSLQQVQQQMTAAVQNAQGQVNSLRNRLQGAGSGSFTNSSTGAIEQPDFKPNNQKTKTFLQRLEYGFNVQSQKSNRWLPSTSDIGLSLGYKLNDKSAVGVGAAYKLGWGQPISRIRFSHQGIGLRSYLDYKLKGSFWLSGGYEMNYQSAFNNIDVLRSYSAWQRSGLIGLNKKIKQGKRTVETKLLWDFLSYQQVPRTPALLFRVEYKLK